MADNFSQHSYYVCSICECAPAVHCFFWECPLLDGEVLCSECCIDDMATDEAISKLAAIGKDYDRKVIDGVCKDCGKRCVKESEDA